MAYGNSIYGLSIYGESQEQNGINSYELSLWEDTFVESRVENQLEGQVVFPAYFEENKKLVIGSSDISFEGKSFNNILIKNIDGTTTLTFSLVSKYIDNSTGEFIKNYLVDELCNESKIKIKYKDNWLTFLVKEIIETKDGEIFIYNYTCQDYFINELQKTGWDLSFSTEDENSFGTIEELSNKILNQDSPDWIIEESEVLLEEILDNLYSAKINFDINYYSFIDNTLLGILNTSNNELDFYIFTSEINKDLIEIIKKDSYILDSNKKIILDRDSRYIIKKEDLIKLDLSIDNKKAYLIQRNEQKIWNADLGRYVLKYSDNGKLITNIDITTHIITIANGHEFKDGDLVQFKADIMPIGLIENYTYSIVYISDTSFKVLLSTDLFTEIHITSSGSNVYCKFIEIYKYTNETIYSYKDVRENLLTNTEYIENINDWIPDGTDNNMNFNQVDFNFSFGRYIYDNKIYVDLSSINNSDIEVCFFSKDNITLPQIWDDVNQNWRDIIPLTETFIISNYISDSEGSKNFTLSNSNGIVQKLKDSFNPFYLVETLFLHTILGTCNNDTFSAITKTNNMISSTGINEYPIGSLLWVSYDNINFNEIRIIEENIIDYKLVNNIDILNNQININNHNFKNNALIKFSGTIRPTDSTGILSGTYNVIYIDENNFKIGYPLSNKEIEIDILTSGSEVYCFEPNQWKVNIPFSQNKDFYLEEKVYIKTFSHSGGSSYYNLLNSLIIYRGNTHSFKNNNLISNKIKIKQNEKYNLNIQYNYKESYFDLQDKNPNPFINSGINYLKDIKNIASFVGLDGTVTATVTGGHDLPLGTTISGIAIISTTTPSLNGTYTVTTTIAQPTKFTFSNSYVGTTNTGTMNFFSPDYSYYYLPVEIFQLQPTFDWIYQKNNLNLEAQTKVVHYGIQTIDTPDTVEFKETGRIINHSDITKKTISKTSGQISSISSSNVITMVDDHFPNGTPICLVNTNWDGHSGNIGYVINSIGNTFQIATSLIATTVTGLVVDSGKIAYCHPLFWSTSTYKINSISSNWIYVSNEPSFSEGNTIYLKNVTIAGYNSDTMVYIRNITQLTSGYKFQVSTSTGSIYGVTLNANQVGFYQSSGLISASTNFAQNMKMQYKFKILKDNSNEYMAYYYSTPAPAGKKDSFYFTPELEVIIQDSKNNNNKITIPLNQSKYYDTSIYNIGNQNLQNITTSFTSNTDIESPEFILNIKYTPQIAEFFEIFSIKLFKEYQDENNIVIPYSTNTFRSTLNEKEDIYFTINKDNQIIPKKIINNFRILYQINNEKIRNFAESKSNKYSLLQKLKELFNCQYKISINNSEDGKYRNKSIKWFSENNDNMDYGFSYGTNLISINREMQSTEIVSKLYVEDSEQTFAIDGICTIERALNNNSKENFILNFDYYIQKGLLSQVDVNNYLYDLSLGVMPKLAEINNNIIEQELNYQNLLDITYNLDSIINFLTIQINILMTDIQNLSIEYQKLTIKTIPPTYEEISPYIIPYFLKQDLIYFNNNKITKLKYLLNGLIEYSPVITNFSDYNDIIQDTTLVTSANHNLFTSGSIIIKIKNTLNYDGFYTANYVNVNSFYINKKFNSSETRGNFEKTEGFKNQLLITEKEINTLKNQRKEILQSLNKTYARFIQEGVWQGDNYINDDILYLNALKTSEESSKPRILYTINVIDLSSLEDYSHLNFDVGDKTFIQDSEFFGYINGVPIKEKVEISEIKWNLDKPEENQITIQNYKSDFNNLFQRLVSNSNNYSLNKSIYNRANNLTANQQINPNTIQNTLNNQSLILKNNKDGSTIIDNFGIEVGNPLNLNKKLKITSGGIFSSNDGGITWYSI